MNIKEHAWLLKVVGGMLVTVTAVTLICGHATANDYMPTPEEIEEEMYFDSLEVMALCVMAEAGGECEQGIRLVVDTILNRVDSKEFPDNIMEVIYQPYAFSCVDNGMIDRVEPTETVFRIVNEELENRTDYRPLYFRTGRYADYGKPLYKVGNHYFSE